jgi:hypothetical protein
LWVSFPALYFLSSFDSKLTIGYRHFYPVLIFIYAGLAFLLNYILKDLKLSKAAFIFIILAYSIFGILGVQANLGYVNFLWPKQKWELITDSTVNWGQEQEQAFIFLNTNNYFKGTQKGTDWNLALDIAGGPNTYLATSKVLGKGQKLENFWAPFVDLKKVELQNIDKEYLMIDSDGLQKLSDDKLKGNDLASKNLEKILSIKPIYEKNDLIFIFETKDFRQ